MTAASLALSEEFGLPVYGDEAVVQGMERPCFFISVIEVSQIPLPSMRKRLQIPVDITYFPEESGKYLSMYQVGQELMSLLEVVTLPDGSRMRGRGQRYELSDGLLHFFESFILHLIPAKDDGVSNGAMEDLDLQLDVD